MDDATERLQLQVLHDDGITTPSMAPVFLGLGGVDSVSSAVESVQKNDAAIQSVHVCHTINERVLLPSQIQIHWPEYFLTLELNNITKQYAVKWCNLKKGQNYII